MHSKLRKFGLLRPITSASNGSKRLLVREKRQFSSPALQTKRQKFSYLKPWTWFNTKSINEIEKEEVDFLDSVTDCLKTLIHSPPRYTFSSPPSMQGHILYHLEREMRLKIDPDMVPDKPKILETLSTIEAASKAIYQTHFWSSISLLNPDAHESLPPSQTSAPMESSGETESVQTIGEIIPENRVDELKMRREAAVRFLLLEQYVAHLRTAMEEGDIKFESIRTEDLYRIVSVCLLGSSSERIAEHMSLYGSTLNAAQLQDCFYTLFEPEVALATAVLLKARGIEIETDFAAVRKTESDGIDTSKQQKNQANGKKIGNRLKLSREAKKVRKELLKFSSAYLLDELELNSKARCVYAWSDPKYTGFKPLPDDHTTLVSELVASRREFFRVGSSVAKAFLDQYKRMRREHYDDRRETREYIRQGAVFFVIICVFDAILTLR